MVVLDVSIVTVALPSAAEDLALSQDALQWVVTAYSLAFGGFLLLGGRAADVFGRQQGVHDRDGDLHVRVADVRLRGERRLADRLPRAAGPRRRDRLARATLAIINTAFRHGGAERNKAFGIWGAVAGSGAAAGVLLGGVLTEYLGWEWIFFVNVPIGIAIIALTPMLVPEGRGRGRRARDRPVRGAAGDGRARGFVYAMSEAPDAGWTSLQTIGLPRCAWR